LGDFDAGQPVPENFPARSISVLLFPFLQRLAVQVYTSRDEQNSGVSMTLIIEHGNLEIHSIGSNTLAIWTHGAYTATTGSTTVPLTAKIIWHSAPDNFSNLTKGHRYINGSRSANDMLAFGMTKGGQKCINYVLSVNKDDPHIVKGDPTVDYVVTKPGTFATLSDLWDAMKNNNLRYSEVHYYACRVKITGSLEEQWESSGLSLSDL
jgi:hypothetical protein